MWIIPQLYSGQDIYLLYYNFTPCHLLMLHSFARHFEKIYLLPMFSIIFNKTKNNQMQYLVKITKYWYNTFEILYLVIKQNKIKIFNCTSWLKLCYFRQLLSRHIMLFSPPKSVHVCNIFLVHKSTQLFFQNIFYCMHY